MCMCGMGEYLSEQRQTRLGSTMVTVELLVSFNPCHGLPYKYGIRRSSRMPVHPGTRRSPSFSTKKGVGRSSSTHPCTSWRRVHKSWTGQKSTSTGAAQRTTEKRRRAKTTSPEEDKSGTTWKSVIGPLVVADVKHPQPRSTLLDGAR